MEKQENRAVMKYFYLKGLTPKEIKEEMDSTLGTSSPSYSTVKHGFPSLKRVVHVSTMFANLLRSAHLQQLRVVDTFANVERERCANVSTTRSCCKCAERKRFANIVDTWLKMSYERVQHILHQHLHMEKLCARWVPRLLTVDQKLIRKYISTANLSLYKRNPSEFLRRFVTIDETWVHHYTPETKEQSKQWIGPGEPTPKKTKTIFSANKVMATVF
ncbi:unnamed protein product [Pieris macdunnoughi]|uniref:Transposase n=1 Tax=Pieris macdunnoughi TaxID=345717 RepID=A0A821Y7H4_9NEOP|nr:unnamed protein product [Pieris macdunnoughi]